MGNAYNSAQTIQSESSESNVVNVYFLNVYDEAKFYDDVTFDGEVDFLGIVNFRNNVGFFNPTYFSSSINVGGPIADPGIIRSPEVELLEYSLTTQAWVSKTPPELLTELFDDVAELKEKIKFPNGIKTTQVELGTFDANDNFVEESPRKLLSELFDDVDDLETDLSSLTSTVQSNSSRISALENP